MQNAKACKARFLQNGKVQNLLLIFLVLVIGLGVLTRPALAQEELKFEIKGGGEATESQKKIEYQLPYPGILPDHPLYRLKMVRDKIWGFLIRDPLKKSQWSLLMADKRIWASEMLVDKEKFDLAVSTATKAEKYLEQAVNQAYQAEKMGKGEKAFFEKIQRASLKHEEILQGILTKAKEELRPVIEGTLDYPKNANQKILMLLEKEP